MQVFNDILYKLLNLNFINSLKYLNSQLTLNQIFLTLWLKTIFNLKFLYIYYLRNEHLWVDGFLFDFLQKKTADIWLRKFVIYTGFLFSERLVFDSVVKLYIDYLIWYMHKITLFEVNNVFEMLTTILYFAVTLFFLIIILIIVI